MTDKEIRERNQRILDELQEERLFLYGNQITVDFGRYGYYHDDLPNITHGSDESIRRYLPEYRDTYGKPFLCSGIRFIDSRPSIQEVVKLVRKVENKIFAAENPDCDYLEYVTNGVWDEGIGVSPGEKGGNVWDVDGKWLAVFVVQGGSEGFWLHAEAIGRDAPTKPLILGKALGASWEDCYRSAGRIGWLLGA